jgi:hypothetical protein
LVIVQVKSWNNCGFKNPALVLITGCWLLCSACTVNFLNPVQAENLKQGDRNWVLTNPAYNHEIEGYASATSVNRGGSIAFFVNTTDPEYTLDVYRMGWYGGLGGRKMLPTITRFGVQQPIPTPDPATGLIECQWADPYVLKVPYTADDPTDWMSGVYLVKLAGMSSGKQAYIIFVVKDEARFSDLLLQTSVATQEAYNSWGGLSLYTVPDRAYKVSFNRPYEWAGDEEWSSAAKFLLWEHFMIQFLEREGYDVTYSTDVDTHEQGGLLLHHRAFLVVGHDEYWSWQMRDNVEVARDSGINLGFFAADVSFWQIRFGPSPITRDADRTIVCYKSAVLDPYDNDGNPNDLRFVTVGFRQPPVNRPEEAMIGVMYDAEIGNGDSIEVSDGSSWVFTDTGLHEGSRLKGLLGYEVDRMFGDAPPGTVRLAHSPFTVNGVTHYSDMTAYSTAAGSTVVATGSINWNWGLATSTFGPVIILRPQPAVQRATRNIFDRFVNGSTPIP